MAPYSLKHAHDWHPASNKLPSCAYMVKVLSSACMHCAYDAALTVPAYTMHPSSKCIIALFDRFVLHFSCYACCAALNDALPARFGNRSVLPVSR